MNIIRRIIQGIIKLIFLTIQKIQGRYRFVKTNVEVPDEPVLFLSNHQLNLDAVRLRAHNSFRIAYVAHDEIYRNALYRWIATNLMDMICRGQSKTDVSYIKELFRAKKKKLSIGIYPEGGINYFNHTQHFDISIAKLAKKLNMPIVIVNSCGGSFVKPRPFQYKGKNIVEYSYKKLISKSELKDMSVETLYEVIKENLYVNDYDWQRKTMSKVNRKKPATLLYRSLFVCPDCKSLHKLNFTNEHILCSNCNKSYTFDEYDFVKGSNTLDNLVSWDILQHQTLIEELKTKTDDEILLTHNVDYACIPIDKYFKKKDKKKANITLTKESLTVTTENDSIIFPVKDLYRIFVEFKNTLQFNYDEKKIRIDSNTLPAYIWVTYLRCLTMQDLPWEIQENFESIDK